MARNNRYVVLKSGNLTFSALFPDSSCSVVIHVTCLSIKHNSNQSVPLFLYHLHSQKPAGKFIRYFHSKDFLIVLYHSQKEPAGMHEFSKNLHQDTWETVRKGNENECYGSPYDKGRKIILLIHSTKDIYLLM